MAMKNVVDPKQWTFVNADVAVALHRPPTGEWVCVDARTVIQPSGIGLTTSRLLDDTGVIGTVTQSLVIDARRPA